MRDILNIDNKVEYILTEGATNKKEKKFMRREEKRDSMHYKSNLTLTNKLVNPLKSERVYKLPKIKQ